MYISLYASTFNTKFNIQTQKGTWTTQTRTLLFRIFTECNILEHHRLPERGFRFSTGFIYQLIFFSFFFLFNTELILLTFFCFAPEEKHLTVVMKTSSLLS